MKKLTWKDYLSAEELETLEVTLPLNPSKSRAELVTNGDWHLKNSHHTKLSMKILGKQHEYISEHPYIRCALLGDLQEQTMFRSRHHIQIEDLIPTLKAEIEGVKDKWSPVIQQTIASVHGNHEERIVKMCQQLGFTGLEPLEKWAKNLNPDIVFPEIERGLLMKLKVGNQTYKGYIAHGTGSARNPLHAFKYIRNNFEGLDFIALGHIHLYRVECKVVWAYDKGWKKKLITNIRTGSILPWCPYAEKKQLEPSALGSPLMILRSDRHQIQVRHLIKDIIL